MKLLSGSWKVSWASSIGDSSSSPGFEDKDWTWDSEEDEISMTYGRGLGNESSSSLKELNQEGGRGLKNEEELE